MAYRGLVAAVARGERFDSGRRAELAGLMENLGLPFYALPRDARAVLLWNESGIDRRVVLAMDHPHLFDDADAWVLRWQADKASRRPAPVAAATD